MNSPCCKDLTGELCNDNLSYSFPCRDNESVKRVEVKTNKPMGDGIVVAWLL
jgi:hypothetical protein